MRIVSGKYKGRRLNPTSLKFARPTTDFAREGLFNVLNNRLNWEGITVLDLYAGSGAMSLEFLSRGVDSVISVDQNYESVKFISSVKTDWKIDNLEILKSDALRYLEKCHLSFDLIFADPPYDGSDHDKLLELVIGKELLKENGTFILEHPKDKKYETHPCFIFERSYGNVNFSFFQKD